MQTLVVHNADLQGGKAICIANEKWVPKGRKDGGVGEGEGSKETVDHIHEKLALLVEQAASSFTLIHKHNVTTPEVKSTFIPV